MEHEAIQPLKIKYRPKITRKNINAILSNKTIIFIIFWDFLTLYQIFFSPVKRSAIISDKHGTTELNKKFVELLKTFREDNLVSSLVT